MLDETPRAHCRGCTRPLYFSERMNREELCRECATDAGVVRIVDARWLRLRREEHQERIAYLADRIERGEVNILRPGDMPSDPGLCFVDVSGLSPDRLCPGRGNLHGRDPDEPPARHYSCPVCSPDVGGEAA